MLSPRPPAVRVEQIMGMPIEIDVRDPSFDVSDLDDAFNWFRWVDTNFSTYTPESQISRLNAGLSIEDDAGEIAYVLQRCLELKQATGGYFDIETNHLPTAVRGSEGTSTTHGLDPSGFVKGWGVDRAGEILEERGARNYSINAGGDIRLRGAALPDSVWRIGIRNPLQPDMLAAVVGANDLAIATSGSYERGQHIFDPHTGQPPTGVLSVTVVGPDLGTADAYATAAYAMGEEGPRWTIGLFGYEAMCILDNELVLKTPGFPSV